MQHASPTRGRSGARASAGLAAAALVVAGLTCAAPAQADVADYPAPVDFSPTLLAVDGGEVFAAGSDYTENDQGDWLPGSGYVARVGGAGTVALGAGTQVSSVTNQGDQVAALGTVSSDEDRAALWDLDFGAADPLTAPLLFGPDEYPTALAQGTDTLYAVGTTAEGHGQVWVDRERIPHGTFDANVTITAAATAVVDGAEVLLIAGTTTDENYAQHPALWTFTGEAPVTRLDLRPGTESYPTDLAVEPGTGTTYVATTGNGADDAIVVVEDGAVTEVAPQRDYIASLDVSEDGGELYISSFSGVTVLDADPVTTSDQENQLSYASLGADVFGAAVVTGGPDQFYVAAGNEDEQSGAVLSVGMPTTPTDLRAVAGDYEGSPAALSWAASTPAGGFAEEEVVYKVTFTDRAGGEPIVHTPFVTEYHVYEGLLPGHTYDVTVASTNFAFTSETTSTVLTIPSESVGHPSKIEVVGKAVVGSKLSLRNTGAWASGASVTRTWYADQSPIGTGPTVTLTKEHLGKQIWAEVTGRKTGFWAHTAFAEPTAKVTAPRRLVAGTARVNGILKVGETLTVKTARWASGTTLSYRWAANRKTIRGAKDRTLELTPAQQGKRIRVTVTGRKAGQTVSKTSWPTWKVRVAQRRRR